MLENITGHLLDMISLNSVDYLLCDRVSNRLLLNYRHQFLLSMDGCIVNITLPCSFPLIEHHNL